MAFAELGMEATLHTASGADIAAGEGVLIGTMVGIAQQAIADGDTGSIVLSGKFKVAKETGAGRAWAVGDLIYWDNTGKVFSDDATANQLCGRALEANADGDTEGVMMLLNTLA